MYVLIEHSILAYKNLSDCRHAHTILKRWNNGPETFNNDKSNKQTKKKYDTNINRYAYMAYGSKHSQL